MTSAFDQLVEEFPAWWIDFLGEHNHVGGIEATRWLASRANLKPGDRILDCGAFVGGAARYLAEHYNVHPVANDINPEFLQAGLKMSNGPAVEWLLASTHRLPFRDGSFASVWSLDSYIAPSEMSRVAAPTSTICICSEVPTDNRGGLESVIQEWEEYGFYLAAHKPMTVDATHQWRQAESQLVQRRPYFESRYGPRGYLMQLDLLSSMVRSYEIHEQGHALLVLTRTRQP
ncbi:MAG: class I SAM-dependent methyltransferase [Tepidiformaceae bacterium]